MKNFFSKYNWKQTRLIELGLALFLVGLLLARFGWVTNWQLVFASLVCCVLIIRRSKWAFLAVAIFCLNIGIFRGQLIYQSFQPLLEKHDQNVHIIGEVQDDPGLANRYQTEFHLVNLKLFEGDSARSIGGRITVRGFSGTKINRQDLVDITGKLRPALGNNQGQVSFAQITVIGKKQHWLETLRRRFIAGAYSGLAEPGASLGLGFLIGTRSLLPKQLEQQLNITGLTHIVAVSGYNLTILIRFARRLLAGYSKYIATAVSVALIVASM